MEGRMIDPIAVGLTKNYISKLEYKYNQDKASPDYGKVISDPTNPTIWIIGAIDSIQKAQIQSTWADIQLIDGETKLVKNKEKFLDSDFEIVRFGLKGFENFGTVKFELEKKKLFDREVDVVSEATLKAIPLHIIREISNVIWNDNHVDEILAKNSN